MCAVLEISRRTYYKYRNADDPDYLDYLMIKKVFDNSKGTYGYRRITEGLKIEYGVIYNHKKIARIMRKYNIKPEYIRRIRPNYNYKRIEENVRPNLLKLSTIIDLYDRHVVAYKISKFNDLSIVINTLNEAIAKEKDVRGLILHSDQGFQYTSNQYKAICESNGITISMARKGTPIDDAPIESWHALLKKETLYNNNITSLQEYQKLVEDWILFYNTDRLKSKQIRK